MKDGIIYMKEKKDVIIYIQCDVRYNDYIMREIEGETVLEYAVLNAKELGKGQTLMTCLYDCAENKKLGKIMEFHGVNVTYSDENHVNKRFIQSVINSGYKYVIRVAADQLLLNTHLMKTIIEEMDRNDYEFFFPESCCSAICADVVQIRVLKKYCEEIYNAERYFHPLHNKLKIKRYQPYQPQLFFPCRANCDDGFYFSKAVIEKHLDILEIQKELIEKLSSSTSDLRKTGMWRSWMLGTLNDFFFDQAGDVNPWWCESAVNLTKSKIENNHELRVFEWGAGNSTLFWAKYAKQVVSVESDIDWYQKMKAIVPNHVRMEYRELIYGGEYSKAILTEKEKFDIIVVDGRDRVGCAQNSVEKLSENGIIIWDNTDRDYYSEGYRYLKEQGFKELKLSGIIWGLPGIRDYTSFFYRKENMWGL